MKAEELRAHFRTRGWKDDGYGHLQKTNDKGQWYRLKFGKMVVRYEVKVKHANGSEWLRLRSGYYGKLSVAPSGKIQGFTR